MERAVLIGNIADLDKAAGYDRLYFGVEFCEIKIPTPDEVVAALAFADGQGLEFTLVTPYVADRGLAAIQKAAGALPRDGRAEVVVNDYGALSLIRDIRPDLNPVFGRLLTKQKRGFGVSAHQDDAPLALAAHWRLANIDTPVLRSYLENLDISRVELDNLAGGFDSDLRGSGLKGSLYHPYGYVTTTRYCPWAFNGTGWPNLRGVCGRSCLRGMIKKKGEVFSQALYLAGNAQFYETEALPAEKELLKKGINRIVHEPNIPV